MQRAPHRRRAANGHQRSLALGLVLCAGAWSLATLVPRPVGACSYAPNFVAVELDGNAAPEPALGVPSIAGVEVRRGADLDSKDGCSYTTTSCSDTGSVRFRLTNDAGKPFDGATAYLVTIEGESASDFFAWPADPVLPTGDTPNEFVIRFSDRDQSVDATITVVPLAANGDLGPSASLTVDDSLGGGCGVASGSGGLGLVFAVVALLGRRRRRSTR